MGVQAVNTLTETQTKNLRAVEEYDRVLGRRLYAGQGDTTPKTLTSLVKLDLLDIEEANDKRKTYGITDEGRKLLG